MDILCAKYESLKKFNIKILAKYENHIFFTGKQPKENTVKHTPA